MPIRWRLTLLNALIIGVILLTLAASTTWLWRAGLIAGVKHTTQRQGEAAAKGLEDGEDLLQRVAATLTHARHAYASA